MTLANEYHRGPAQPTGSSQPYTYDITVSVSNNSDRVLGVLLVERGQSVDQLSSVVLDPGGSAETPTATLTTTTSGIMIARILYFVNATPGTNLILRFNYAVPTLIAMVDVYDMYNMDTTNVYDVYGVGSGTAANPTITLTTNNTNQLLSFQAVSETNSNTGVNTWSGVTGQTNLEATDMGSYNMWAAYAYQSGSGSVTMDAIGANSDAYLAPAIAWKESTIIPDALTAQNIVSAEPIISTPTIAQTHILTSSAILTAVPVIDAPTFGQTHVLTGSSITTGPPIISTPTLGLTHVLTSQDIITEPSIVSLPAAGQTHILLSSSIISAEPLVSVVSIGQTHVLSATNVITEEPIVDTPSVSPLADELTGQNVVTYPVVVQKPNLASGGAGGPGLLDDFNRANGAPGSNWTLNNTFLNIVSNVLKHQTGGWTLGLWNQTSFGADQEVSAKIAYLDTSGNEWDLVLKAQDLSFAPDPPMIEALYNPSNGNWEIWLHDGSNGWTQAGGSVNSPSSVGDIIRATAEADGTVTIYKNGDLVIQRDISGLWSYYDQGGYLGVYCHSSGTNGQAFDDFSGGDMGSAAAPENLSGKDVFTIPVVSKPTLSSSPSDDLVSQNVVTVAPIVNTPALGQTHVLVSTDIQSAEPTVIGPVIGQTHELNSSNVITDIPSASKPNFQQTHILLAANIISDNPTVDRTTIGQIQVLDGNNVITGIPAIDAVTLGQTHILLSNNVITESPIVTSPDLYSGLTHNLTALDVVADTPIVNNPALAQSHILNSISAVAGPPTVDKTIIGQTHILISNNVISADSIVSMPSMAATHELTAINVITESAVISVPTLGQVHTLIGIDVLSEIPVIDQAAIAQTHILVSADVVTSPVEVSLPNLSEIPPDDLISQDVASGEINVDTPALGQMHILVSDSVLANSPVVELPDIGQTHILSSNDVIAEPPIVSMPLMTETSVLVSVDVISGEPEVSQGSLTQTHVLLANNVSAVVLVSAPVIAQIHILTSSNVQASSPIVSKPTMIETSVLVSSDITTEPPVVDIPMLVEINALTSRNVISADPQVDISTLGQMHLLSADDIVGNTPTVGKPLLALEELYIPEERWYRIPAENRTIYVGHEDRTVSIPYENRTVRGDMRVIEKDPSATLDYPWDWTDFVGNDVITLYSFTIPDELTLVTAVEDNGVVTAWISGGILNKNYIVTCHIETAGGRKDERSARFIMVDK